MRCLRALCPVEYGAIVETSSDSSESNTVPPASSRVRLTIARDISDASPPCSRTWNSPASKVDVSLCTEWWRGRCWPHLLSSSYSLKDCMNQTTCPAEAFPGPCDLQHRRHLQQPATPNAFVVPTHSLQTQTSSKTPV